MVRTTYDRTLSLPAQLEEMRQAAIWKIIRGISWVTLALLAAKIVILPTVIDWWNSQMWTKVLTVYVMPNMIHPWRVATGLNSMIALCGYYYFLDPARGGCVKESGASLQFFALWKFSLLFVGSFRSTQYQLDSI